MPENLFRGLSDTDMTQVIPVGDFLLCVVSALAWLIAGKPVNEVALSLGYDNASSFATMFRRVTGQPPSFYHPA